jgi:hypothetical protein
MDSIECDGAGIAVPNSITFFIKETGANFQKLLNIASNDERFHGSRHDENEFENFPPSLST